ARAEAVPAAVVVAGEDCEHARAPERLREHWRVARVRRPEGALQPVDTLGVEAAHVPEDREGGRKAEHLIGCRGREQLVERDVKVLVLLRELLEARGLLAAREARLELLDEANEILGVATPERGRVARVRQFRRGELADRLEESETSLGFTHEALVDERCEDVEVRVADALGRVQRETP